MGEATCPEVTQCASQSGREPASGLGLGCLRDLATRGVKDPRWNQADWGSHQPQQVASFCHSVHDGKMGLARLPICWAGRGLQAAGGAPAQLGTGLGLLLSAAVPGRTVSWAGLWLGDGAAETLRS